MDKKAFYAEIEKICELDSGKITGEEHFSENGLFDSLAILSLISILDSKFKIQVNQKELFQIGTVHNLYEYVS